MRKPVLDWVIAPPLPIGTTMAASLKTVSLRVVSLRTVLGTLLIGCGYLNAAMH
jgi:hypothetical protein